MAASSCRRPRLRYSMTFASPCMVRIPCWFYRDRQVWNNSNLAQNTRHDKGAEHPRPCAAAIIKCWFAELAAMPAAWATLGACVAGASDRLVHDPADGSRTPAALRATAETAVDLAGRAGPLRKGDRRADVPIAQHVAGADDHGGRRFPGALVRSATIDSRRFPPTQKQNSESVAIPNCSLKSCGSRDQAVGIFAGRNRGLARGQR